ncbi:MAG: TonB-dependent receptor, partial [Muribaculaceae bacterium]|nr:TonB-dependent receptor [Muribaculaceae bacterium]
MKQTIIALLAWITASLSALAYNVTGVVVDEESQPMIKATVRVLHPKDSTAVKGALTNEKGEFRITDVANGSYLLEASYVGYSPIYKEITVKGKSLAVGTVSMAEDTKMLRDVTVTGIKTPIKVMEDTIEFNADSYKTQPNAVVEDLLKRLPGVDVGTDGKITANGKEVKKILVDGKEFFSDDPSAASKNIPVDLVDKLQVVDRKSDLARLTGVDDGEDETVINLTVKKGKNNGWFGNVDAGYGTDDRYDFNFNVNRFWNGNQLTLLGGANNINNPRFGDRGGDFRRFGGRSGLLTSRSVGLNFNVGNEEILRVGGDLMYSYSKTDNRTRSDKQTFFQDYNSYDNTMRNAKDELNSLSGNFRLEWKPDSFNTLDFRPNFEVKSNDSEQFRVSETMTGPTGSDVSTTNVNNSTSLQKSHGSSYSFGGRFIYNHNFKRR